MSDQDGSELQYDVSELPIEDFFHYTPSLALACIALSLYVLVSAAAPGARRPPTGSRHLRCRPKPCSLLPVPPCSLQPEACCQQQPSQTPGRLLPHPRRPPRWLG